VRDVCTGCYTLPSETIGKFTNVTGYDSVIFTFNTTVGEEWTTSMRVYSSLLSLPLWASLVLLAVLLAQPLIARWQWVTTQLKLALERIEAEELAATLEERQADVRRAQYFARGATLLGLCMLPWMPGIVVLRVVVPLAAPNGRCSRNGARPGVRGAAEISTTQV